MLVKNWKLFIIKLYRYILGFLEKSKSKITVDELIYEEPKIQCSIQ